MGLWRKSCIVPTVIWRVGAGTKTKMWRMPSSKLFSSMDVSYVDDSLKSLTGSVSRDFLPLFFHDLNPSGPLINSIKYFLWFRFQWDIQTPRLRGVYCIAESDSAVCIVSLSQTLWCVSYCWVRLCGVHHKSQQSDKIILLVNTAIMVAMIRNIQ